MIQRVTYLALWVHLLWFGIAIQVEAEPAGAPAEGRPFLWKIERQPPSYLFGTIHVPDERVLALPPSVERAFGLASIVYTEVAMDLRSQVEAQRLSMFSGATTLRTVLPDELYSRLETYLASRGVPMLLFTRFKVWAVASSLPLLDQMQKANGRQVLDMYLSERASSEGKQTDALETIESQVAVMESMGEDGQVSMLRQTLDQLEEAATSGEDLIEDMVQTYLSGDSERLMQVAQAQLDQSNVMTPKLQDALIYTRNRTMSETIRKKLDERPQATHFFAIGVLHYPGERGIVELLRKSGIEVTRAP